MLYEFPYMVASTQSIGSALAAASTVKMGFVFEVPDVRSNVIIS